MADEALSHADLAFADVQSITMEIVQLGEGVGDLKSLGALLARVRQISKRCHELGDAWARIEQAVLDTPLDD